MMDSRWMRIASLLIVAALLFGCAAQQQRQAGAQPADAAPDAGQPSPGETAAGQPLAEEELPPQPPAGEQPDEPQLEPAPESPVEPAPAAPEVKEFRIEAFRFGFEPSRIEVDRGDTVRIIATSRDGTHGFALPQYDVSLRLTMGTEQVAEFVADTPGEFPFYCNIPCGSGHSGMKGTLVVR